jgi:thioredoxin reductase (NADPH)
MEIVDVVIIGTGPAGLTAAIYCARYNLKTIVLGKVFGGTMSMALDIGNWPGIEKTSGVDLATSMINHVKSLGVQVLNKEVTNITKRDEDFIVDYEDYSILAKKIILASGTKRRKLNLDREEEFTGAGISYCNTCDGIYFKNKVVGVVGAGNAGCSSANELSGIAKKVYMFCPEPTFMFAEPARSKLIEDNPNIIKHFSSNIVELLGDDRLRAIKLKTGEEIKLDGLFIEIGSEPDIEFLEKIGVDLNKNGYIMVDDKLRTSVKGVFSAGSVNDGAFDQAIYAAAQGALAANSVYRELKK